MVAFVSNNSFVADFAFDGMRKHFGGTSVLSTFSTSAGMCERIPKISGTTHNVFGIQVGVSISLFIRRANDKPSEAESSIFE